MNNTITKLTLATFMISITGMMGISFDLAFAQSNQPPTVSIIDPDDGFVIVEGAPITLFAREKTVKALAFLEFNGLLTKMDS